MNLPNLRAWLGMPADAKVRVGPDCEVQIVDSLSNPPASRSQLMRVVNPYGRCEKNLNEMFAHDPAAADETLRVLAQEARAEIEKAVRLGAGGIAYFLYGADSEHCSPMQYGGHYLEHDRELLSMAGALSLNMLVVPGGPGAYIEIVADLPAAIMAWDVRASGRSIQQVRSVFSGLLCADDPAADLLWLAGSFGSDYVKRGEAIA